MTRLKELRQKAGIKQTDLCAKLGVSQGTLSGWETGKYSPPIESIMKLCEIFDVSVDYLLGRFEPFSNDAPPGPNWIPIKGVVRAGIPIDAIEDVIGWEELLPSAFHSGTFFGLRIIGDSMEPRISEGDIAIVRVQPDLESGDIGVVMVNGDTATIKKVIKREDGIMLVALNPNYEPKFYTNKEITTLPVRVLGKVVELRAKF